MAPVASIVRTAVEYGLLPFDLLPPLLSLTLFSIVSGVLMLWVVGKVTPQRRIDRARDRIAAALYEMRLFIDSPRRIVAAQGQMFYGLLLYLAYLTPAFVILTAPLGLLYVHLEVRHGLDPVPVNAPLVVRVDLDASTDGTTLTVEDSPGVRVTAPPLVDADHQRVYLRVVALEPGDHDLSIRVGDATVSKRVSADPEGVRVSPERASGLAAWWSFGDESPVDADTGVRAIAIRHPETPQSWLGLPIPWWVYWLIVSTIAALLLRRPMGVVL